MTQSRPVSVTLPASGVVFVESVHAGDFQMPPRTDPFHKVLYVVRGTISYVEAGRPPERVPGGSLLIVPAGVRHQLRDERASTLFLLCFRPAFLTDDPELPRLWSELAGRPRRLIAVPRPTQNQIESSWRRAMLERVQSRPGAMTTVRTLAAGILVTLVRMPATDGPSDPATRVTAVAREIEETFYDAWSLDRAAARAGVSRRHFSKLFRQVSGHTFLEYLTNLRLTHATHLLRQGGHSVAGVVFSCGFGDVSQFYRLFRARFRLPPKQWALQAGHQVPAAEFRGASPRRRG
ncbi:MAG TPA: AraC family transcriptional regulator [Opitutaceae bacterium]|nr:AraC family transcriptional regulator [Opitutaceae bacterium]